MKVGITYARNAYQTLSPMAFAAEVERLGFDSLWLPDQPAAAEFDPLTALAAAAQVTSSIQLGTCVIAVPLQHPLLIAKQALSTDVLSGGRLVLGVGCGNSQMEAQMLGTDYASRGEVTEEGVELIHRLTRETRVTHAGKRWQFVDLTIEPRPVRQDGIPLWIGGSWKERIAIPVLKRAARYGDGFFAIGMPADAIAGVQDKVYSYAAELGRSLNDFTWATWMAVHIGQSSEQAAVLANQEFQRRYGTRSAFNSATNLIGTLDHCQDIVAQYRQAGVQKVLLSLYSAPEQIMSQLELVVSQILPQLRA